MKSSTVATIFLAMFSCLSRGGGSSKALLLSSTCPTECFCDPLTFTMTCVGHSALTSFPSESSNTNDYGLKRLQFQSYAVGVLNQEMFRGLLMISANVSELVLSHNSITSVDYEAFSVSKPSILSLLDLSHNNLTQFVLQGPSSSLHSLRVLDLSSNRIKEIRGINSLLSIESINLRDNKLDFIHAETFQGLKNLQYVNVEHNALQQIDPGVFSDLPALSHLILSMNPLTPTGFILNSRVQFIDLSHTGLKVIPPALMSTVRNFRASNNSIESLVKSSFNSYPNVVSIVLDDALINSIEDDTFGQLEFLT